MIHEYTWTIIRLSTTCYFMFEKKENKQAIIRMQEKKQFHAKQMDVLHRETNYFWELQEFYFELFSCSIVILFPTFKVYDYFPCKSFCIIYVLHFHRILLVEIFLHLRCDYRMSKSLFGRGRQQALLFLYAWQLKKERNGFNRCINLWGKFEIIVTHLCQYFLFI